MRFVTPNTEAQQMLSVLHRLRESLIRDRTKSINQLHGILPEFGICLPRGMAVMLRLSTVLAECELPRRLVVLLQRLHTHFGYLGELIKEMFFSSTIQASIGVVPSSLSDLNSRVGYQ